MAKENLGKTVKYQTPLREAQRALTKSRIKDAARNLFYARHYDSTTVEEIASSAKVRRSTLYLHYRDKIEILKEVIAEYASDACNAMAKLPGPWPTERQLNRWILGVADMVGRERVRISILMELRRSKTHNMGTLANLTAELLVALGTHNPIFIESAREGSDPALRAQALLLLQQLTYACELYHDDGGSAFGKSLLQQTAKDFHRFLAEPHH